MDHTDEFDAYAREVEPRLWRALVPLVGPDRASEAAADALVHAWQHWDRVRDMGNRAGYLYQVARRAGLRGDRRLRPDLPVPSPSTLPDIEPSLVPALLDLSEMQRSAVWLVEACGWTLAEAADVLGISVSTLRNHLARGMKNLRAALKVTTDA